MLRRLIPTFLIVLIADAHNGGDAEKASTSYLPEAAAVSSTYQAAAAAHFAGYRAALESATTDTGDPIFIEASQRLFANLVGRLRCCGCRPGRPDASARCNRLA